MPGRADNFSIRLRRRLFWIRCRVRSREIEKLHKSGKLWRVPKNILNLETKGKAKGSFFAKQETLPYVAKGIVRGQATSDACVPAVCRMLIFDHSPHLERDINFSESYLRHFLRTDSEGSTVSAIPSVLGLAGLETYEYRDDLTLAQLSEAVGRGFAVVSVRGKWAGWHVLIVEQITAQWVALRDSLPDNVGSSYLLGRADFEAAWLTQKNHCGIGVIVVK